jgi:elongation factor Tu
MALEGDASEMGEGSIMKLADALDSYIPEPKRAIDGPFLMPVEDVFDSPRHGGDRLSSAAAVNRRRARDRGPETDAEAVRVSRCSASCRPGPTGDNVGASCAAPGEEVERGQVLAAATFRRTKFTCEVYVLSKEEGGRHTPFFNGYRPQFYFRTTDVTGSVELPAGAEDGDAWRQHPDDGDADRPIAMEEGCVSRSRRRPHRRRRRRYQSHQAVCFSR